MVLSFAQLHPHDITDLDVKALALNITVSVDGFKGEVLTPAWIMSFVQRAWRISESESADVELIFATYRVAPGRHLILGVFEYGGEGDKRDSFVKSPYPHIPSDRRIFLAKPAPEELWCRYAGHYLPEKDTIGRNPIKYIEP